MSYNKKYWKNTMEYRRILEILDDYWLTEPEEDLVRIDMHFEKGNETQDKLIIWRRSAQERTAKGPFNLVPVSAIDATPTSTDVVNDIVDNLFNSEFSTEEIIKILKRAIYKTETLALFQKGDH